MKIEIVKGSSFEIQFTVYDEWTGDSLTSTIADISGATIKFMAKKKLSDPDSSAIIDKTGSVISGSSGTGKISFAASETNAIKDLNLKYEILVKKSGGSAYHRTGKGDFIIDENVINTLP